jgi:hypothetical protein
VQLEVIGLTKVAVLSYIGIFKYLKVKIVTHMPFVEGPAGNTAMRADVRNSFVAVAGNLRDVVC